MKLFKKQKGKGGIGFVGLLTIVFIFLKLTNYINWSWFWVLSPIWISFALTIIFLIIYFRTELTKGD